jgi:hypothetical protein
MSVGRFGIRRRRMSVECIYELVVVKKNRQKDELRRLYGKGGGQHGKSAAIYLKDYNKVSGVNRLKARMGVAWGSKTVVVQHGRTLFIK